MRYPVLKPCGVHGTMYEDGDILIDPSDDTVRSLKIHGAIGDPLPDEAPGEPADPPDDPPVDQPTEPAEPTGKKPRK